GTVDIWINGELAEAGFSADNRLRGAIRGFEFNSGAAQLKLFLFDEVIVRNYAHVTGLETPESLFDAWRTSHFTTEELADESISGPLADANGDGVANLLAYALNLDPRVP